MYKTVCFWKTQFVIPGAIESPSIPRPQPLFVLIAQARLIRGVASIARDPNGNDVRRTQFDQRQGDLVWLRLFVWDLNIPTNKAPNEPHASKCYPWIVDIIFILILVGALFAIDLYVFSNPTWDDVPILLFSDG